MLLFDMLRQEDELDAVTPCKPEEAVFTKIVVETTDVTQADGFCTDNV